MFEVRFVVNSGQEEVGCDWKGIQGEYWGAGIGLFLVLGVVIQEISICNDLLAFAVLTCAFSSLKNFFLNNQELLSEIIDVGSGGENVHP